MPSLIRLKRGTTKECERLLHAVLWSDFLCEEPFYLEDKLVNEGDWARKFNMVGFNARLAATDMSSAIRGNVATDDSSFVLHPRLHRLAEIVFSHFGVSCDDEEMMRCTTEYGYGTRRDGTHYVVSVPDPTAHEQLEVNLHLRDFLRDKVSPAELAELMDNS